MQFYSSFSLMMPPLYAATSSFRSAIFAASSFSGIGIRDHHTFFHFLYDRDLRCILMVPIKWFVLRKRQMVGIEDQGIARDSPVFGW